MSELELLLLGEGGGLSHVTPSTYPPPSPYLQLVVSILYLGAESTSIGDNIVVLFTLFASAAGILTGML